ncbi:hypothetical protein L1987_31816 [Smallanthus sonchifolius]|uniref:Uncharacterized protein n=1 Tax=Smallanthus sonchifolius TaxID=185202 RepID=A0ACB9I789_9ASTR|nr:hypothetical protein L1987_31816 [Smallanthus sonchifolius]
MPLSSSSSLLLVAAGTLAFGSLLFISRRFLPPTSSASNNPSRLHHEYHTNLPQRRFNIRRLDLSFRVGRNLRIVLLVQVATFFVHENGNRTQLWFSIRIGGSSVEKEVNALMILLLLRWLMTPVFVEMMEEVDYASIMYLCSLRLPLIAWAIA